MLVLLRPFRGRRIIYPLFAFGIVLFIMVLRIHQSSFDLTTRTEMIEEPYKFAPSNLRHYPISQEKVIVPQKQDKPVLKAPDRPSESSVRRNVVKAEVHAQLRPPDVAQARPVLKSSPAEVLDDPINPHANRLDNAEDITDEIGGKTLEEIQTAIRGMMKHAWDAYVKHAWGYNELRPVTKKGHQPEVLGRSPLGATIVDALDTLYIMDMMEEFEVARDWVEANLHFDKPGFVSVFEFTIRYLGGLLSAYTFTRDGVFLNKSVELADRLLLAFNTPTGLPMSLLDLKTGATRSFAWAPGRCAILSEMGTLHMEFHYLSELTKNDVYAKKVEGIRQSLLSINRPNGLFYNFVGTNELKFCQPVAGLSGLGDSFYEYLLKEWVRTRHRDTEARMVYDESIKALEKNGIFQTSSKGHRFIGGYRSGYVSSTMDHLACFAGGMLAFGASSSSDHWFQLGANLTETCRLSYATSETQLGPEIFSFSKNVEAVAIKTDQKHYLLRPEVIESYFYMWRLTKDKKYREWAFDAFMALEKYCRVDAGYSGLQNVYSSTPGLDDVQQTYFFSETLKYLYLIFSSDSVISLDQWVFNSEGHPLPIMST